MADDHEWMGMKKSKIQTYLILGTVLLIGVVVASFALSNKEAAKSGVDKFLGLPGWAFPVIAALVGAFIFWIGLKSEADWPEAFGALVISGALLTGEIMIGWSKFALAGIWILPIVWPCAVFLILLAYGQARSK